jgi:uncharacterized membrane protein
MLLGGYLDRDVRHRWILPMELTVHGLCAIGIQLGRIDRFNSWDLVARPHHVVRSLGGLDWGLVALAFAVVSVGYAVMKPLTLLAMAGVRELRSSPVRALRSRG